MLGPSSGGAHEASDGSAARNCCFCGGGKGAKCTGWPVGDDAFVVEVVWRVVPLSVKNDPRQLVQYDGKASRGQRVEDRYSAFERRREMGTAQCRTVQYSSTVAQQYKNRT